MSVLKAIGSGLDFIFNKMLPKKFIAFMFASYFLHKDKISGEWWAIITLTWVSVTVLQKLIPGITSKWTKEAGDGK